MSITLEGKTVETTDGRTWSGFWRFTKEKKSFLSYTFKQSGNVVPRDLYDYVSFVNEPPSAITPVAPGRKSKDKTKAAKTKVNKVSRGRGRPPSIGSLEGASASALSNGTTAEEVAQIGNNVPPNDAEGNNVDEDDGEDGNENEDGDRLERDDDNVNETFDTETGMDVDNEGEERSEQGDTPDERAVASTEVPADGEQIDGESTAPAFTAAPQGLGPDITLEVTHPLIGMWEGSFNVKIPTGTILIILQWAFILLTSHMY